MDIHKNWSYAEVSTYIIIIRVSGFNSFLHYQLSI
jgi:hypothetical protein